ncbi:MAG: 4Fe-4S dicluster domain-containing protein [Desulforudis sp.]|jgi:ferredoxin|nr:4Fe-4S binding protein [Clostridia bacterium]MDQ7791807.1 4Fe-4S binding protein [Clostridia bacterium]RJX19957.1 MAG: 4Fe-4S dicluster domain-containing protein [Desulforudis sp.]
MGLKFAGDKCIGCKLCQLACSAAGEGVFNPLLARLFVSSYYEGPELKVQGRVCTLCGTCVETCPTNAITFAEGQLSFIPENCDVCGMCIAVCPEQVITPRENGVALCNLCGGSPWCIKWCPHEALVLEEVS